jgi:predicted metal-dependent peptidase
VIGSPLDLDRLAAAKLWLTSDLGDQPYLSSALYALQATAVQQVETMTADRRWRLSVNPGWLAGAPVPDIALRLAHLTWHLLAEHPQRARSLDVGSRQVGTWRTATDVTIGETLAGAGLTGHDLPSAASLTLAPGRSAEEHYAVLARLPVEAEPRHAHPGDPDGRGDCGSAADGLARSYETCGPDTPGVDSLAAAEIRRQVAIEFRRHVTTRGTHPGDALRWVQHVLDPKVPWRDVLSAAVRRAAGWANGHSDYTYSRPSRRQAATPRVVLPSTRRPLPTVAVVVDTSASVDDGLLAQALGEVDGAIGALGVPGSEVTVLACDAAVHTVARVRRAAEARLGGGGGTDLRAGVDLAQRLRPRPDVLVVLTDGWTPWPEAAPAGMAVVAGLLSRAGMPPPPPPAWAVRVDCRLP